MNYLRDMTENYVYKFVVYHLAPNSWSKVFRKYTEGYEFTEHLTPDCDFIFCGSVTMLGQAIKEYRSQLDIVIPIYCWVWDLPVGLKPDSTIKNYITLLKQCDRVFSASKFTQGVLKKYGIDSEQCYFYADTDYLDDIPQLGKRYDVIQASRMVRHKKFEDVVEATTGLELDVVFTGAEQDKAYTEELKRKAIGDYDFKGLLSHDLYVKTLKRSRILVSASTHEGWGLSPVEALWCEIPIILRDIPVFHEIYGNAISYFHNIETLRYHIRHYLETSDDNRRSLAFFAKEKIKDFTPQKFAKRWEELVR